MPQEYDPAGVTRKRYRNLQVKHEKFVRRAAIAGAVAGLVIVTLNGKVRTQAKTIDDLAKSLVDIRQAFDIVVHLNEGLVELAQESRAKTLEAAATKAQN